MKNLTHDATDDRETGRFVGIDDAVVSGHMHKKICHGAACDGR